MNVVKVNGYSNVRINIKDSPVVISIIQPREKEVKLAQFGPTNHCRTDGWYEVFVLICCAWFSVNYYKTSLLWSSLPKGHCCRGLVVCSD